MNKPNFWYRLLTLCSCLLLYACPADPTKQATPAQPVKIKTYSYLCEGEDKSIVVTIDGDRGHLFSYQLSQALARETDSGDFSGSDVYYRPNNPPDLAPGQTAGITINGVKHQNCKNNPRAAVWEAAKLRGVDYRALGQEPAWQLEIRTGTGFLLVTEYGENRVEFPYAEPQVNQAEGSTRYESQLDGDNIRITIRGEECSDSMSGETFSSKVEVSWQGEMLRGCGRALH
jgi:putative lipoprotein